ncbi:MAG: TAT-variant-translocated molybdopterin oxidoreductase [Bacteroidia bacterium]|nr:TAT-variant-translocated molybdopterin oxidoreductase [Bacteroidia bacterium]
MENKNKYWKGLEELNNDPKFIQNRKNEFAEGIPLEEVLTEKEGELTANRRDFLKYFGFGVSAVALAACNKAPIKNAIPYLVKPETISPGIPNWYASTNPNTGVSLLVKTREGRPVKIEGNPESSIFKGGVGAIDHASVLELYDNERLQGPKIDGKDSDWKTIDEKLTTALSGAKNIRLVSGNINSPSAKRAITEFTTKYPQAKHVTYEPISYNAIIEANNQSFGKAVIPGYQFDKANVIVGFNADFLGTWISPVEYTKQWVKNRKVGSTNNGAKTMSRHYQFESNLSLTGSNADIRIPIKPSAETVALISLYNKVATLAGATKLSSPGDIEFAVNMVENAAKELWENKGASLVVCGTNNITNQLIVNAINSILGNIGKTVDLDNYSNQKGGNDAAFETFVAELNSGSVDAVIFLNSNPAYNYYNSAKLIDGIKKAAISVSTNSVIDETTALCKYVAPSNHFLESWGDVESRIGYVGFVQPTISPVYNTRQETESLLRWSGNSTEYYDYVKNYWVGVLGSESAWNKAIHNGFTSSMKTPVGYTTSVLPQDAVNAAFQTYTSNKDKVELSLYIKVGVNDGRYANNPWLQELPDPISKVCWDNYASIGKVTADRLNIKDGDLVNIKSKSGSIENIPVLVQPGQARETISIALGYGRTAGGRVGKNVGKNAYVFAGFNGKTFDYTANDITVEKANGSYELAQTQTHHTIEGRDIIREASLKEFIKDPNAGNHTHAHIITLWDEHDTKGHRWAMAIDLNACTGCGACVVSCNAENNVAVVGRQEILKSREMHWIRIDRYYSFKNHDGKTATRENRMAGEWLKGKEEGLITAADTDFENVRVAFQPMLCQHCGHAPCETVCPVLATVHSSEGLNHMAYNRCVGTRYCANNCPYKVRRFNWFKYAENDQFDYYMNNDLGRMVLNPDVTVRSRGVMEKCSFCIQRIQAGKLQAKLENRKVKDGDVKTACQQSCPADAIIFGDVNDSKSEIAKLYKNERSYVVLEEYNVQPSITYMTKIRNVEESLATGKKASSHEKAHAEHAN